MPSPCSSFHIKARVRVCWQHRQLTLTIHLPHATWWRGDHLVQSSWQSVGAGLDFTAPAMQPTVLRFLGVWRNPVPQPHPKPMHALLCFCCHLWLPTVAFLSPTEGYKLLGPIFKWEVNCGTNPDNKDL